MIPTLIQLRIHGNKIGDEEVKLLCEALKVNKTLKWLDICDYEIGDEGAKLLTETLKDNTTLRDLDIRHNRFGEETGEALRTIRYNEEDEALNLRVLHVKC